MLVKLLLVKEAKKVTLVKLIPSKERKRETVFKEKGGVNNVFLLMLSKRGRN